MNTCHAINQMHDHDTDFMSGDADLPGVIALKEIIDILSADLLRSVLSSKKIKIHQLNSIISLLIKANIAFSLSFYPKTSTSDASASLSITLRPNVSINISMDMSDDAMIMDYSRS
ncbi:MAG TPA: hypothetical protein GX505_13260 [Clostridiales bacterium]|nr:hypothetical protein [Clostridiales bacterium]